MNRREFAGGMLGVGALGALGARGVLADHTELTTRAIPASGEQIPIIGVGTNRYGVGDDAEKRAPLKKALAEFHALGGTVIDTAPMYRSSEIVLGELIGELGIGSDLFMATKVDVEGQDAVVEHMERSFDRLFTDEMELMQVHNFIGWQDALPVMTNWKEEGRIRYVGITTSREAQYETMEKVMREHALDFIQINYSLANQRKSAERILPLAEERGIAVLVNRPFGGGGVFQKLSGVELPGWATELGIASWAQFLLKYALSHPAVTCAIPGMTKARHVADNMAAARGPFPDQDQRVAMEQFFDEL